MFFSHSVGRWLFSGYFFLLLPATENFLLPGAKTCRLAVTHSLETRQIQQAQVCHRKDKDGVSLAECGGNTLIKIANSMHSCAQWTSPHHFLRGKFGDHFWGRKELVKYGGVNFVYWLNIPSRRAMYITINTINNMNYSLSSGAPLFGLYLCVLGTILLIQYIPLHNRARLCF